MKRHIISLVLPVVFFTGAIAQAQQRSPNVQTDQDEIRRRVNILNNVLNGLRGAWWTDTALVQRLGLTEDQKARIQRAFENHRPNLESSKALLEKEESQLGRLLDAEPIDRSGVLLQIDRVTQARSEMERTNAVMTLEMREVLTRAQWSQLSQQKSGVSLDTLIRTFPNTTQSAPKGGGGRGQRQ